MSPMTTVDESISLNGRDIAYRTLPGRGTPALLLHGVGLSQQAWGGIPDALSAQGIPVIVMDLPGHGRSSGGRGDYSVAGFAAVARDLLDHLEVRRVDLVGHSLGGGVSLSFAFLFPERARRLVLVASGGLGEEALGALRLASAPGASLILSVAVADMSIRAARILGQALARVGIHPLPLDPAILASAAELGDAERRDAFVATLRSSMGLDGQHVSALEHLSNLDGRRVLIVWGTDDPVLPFAHGERAHDLLPGSVLEVFPGVGHEPHRADPERFVRVVVQHLRPGR